MIFTFSFESFIYFLCLSVFLDAHEYTALGEFCVIQVFIWNISDPFNVPECLIEPFENIHLMQFVDLFVSPFSFIVK